MAKQVTRESMVNRAVELARMMTCALVDHEDAVRVETMQSPSPRHVFLRISVHDSDVRYLFGKEGKNFNSMRVILECMFRKQRCKIELICKQDRGPNHQRELTSDDWKHL